MLRGTDLITLSWLLSSGLLCPPLAKGVCRSLRSGKHVGMDSKLSLWKSPFLFFSRGSMAIEWMFRGSQTKLSKICPHFLKNKILLLLWWEEQTQLGFCFYTDCKKQFCCTEHSAQCIFLWTPFPWGSLAGVSSLPPWLMLKTPWHVLEGSNWKGSSSWLGQLCQPQPPHLWCWNCLIKMPLQQPQLCPSLVSHSYLPAASALFISLASWRKRNNT